VNKKIVRIVQNMIHRLCGQKVGFFKVTAGGSHAYRSGMKGYGTVTEQQQDANTNCYRRPQCLPATKW